MTYNGTRPTEECPLTKESGYRYRLSTICGDGLKFIISCFSILTIAITTTLVMQLFYADNTPLNTATIHGAVATDYTNCSQIGTKVLRKGGNAVDAAVAATVCMTVVAPHKTGLGGGGYVMIYNHREQSDPVIIDFLSGGFQSSDVRVPAVLRGLESAHKLKGDLPWSQVIEPSVALAKEGFVVSRELASEISKDGSYETLYGHLNAGDVLKLRELADTLKLIADSGSEVLYNGSLSRKLLQEDSNTAEELDQLARYEPSVYTARKTSFYDYVVYHSPNSSAISVLLPELQRLRISAENASTTEAQLLFARALINATSGIPGLIQNVKEERYTGVMVMDWEDTYVCVLTGLNEPLGLRYMTATGFLLDKAGSGGDLLPMIFHDKETQCGLRGLIGTDDPILASQLLYNLLLRGLNVSQAIEHPRYYLLPDGLAVERDEKHSTDGLIYNQLTSIVPASHVDANFISASVNGIVKRRDAMSSHSDSRGGGLASRF